MVSNRSVVDFQTRDTSVESQQSIHSVSRCLKGGLPSLCSGFSKKNDEKNVFLFFSIDVCMLSRHVQMHETLQKQYLYAQKRFFGHHCLLPNVQVWVVDRPKSQNPEKNQNYPKIIDFREKTFLSILKIQLSRVDQNPHLCQNSL